MTKRHTRTSQGTTFRARNDHDTAASVEEGQKAANGVAAAAAEEEVPDQAKTLSAMGIHQDHELDYNTPTT